jgi:hypothetical protein
MEMLELHQENTNVNIQIRGNSAGASAMVHRSVREMGTFMPPAHGCGKCNMQSEEEA